MYIDKLCDIVNKYNNKCYRTIKIKLVDLNSSTYINFGIENNEKDSKLEVSDQVRISKYKNNLAKLV